MALTPEWDKGYDFPFEVTEIYAHWGVLVCEMGKIQ